MVGITEAAFILSIYSSVVSTWILLILKRRKVLSREDISDIANVILALIQLLNDKGVISKEDYLKLLEVATKNNQ
ncbi:MAG: hypothetical protein ACTSR0_03990 [Candidatus Asgardarchaeia archaeon]